MTRVIGLLSFWDESPTWLAATLASMARVCDHAVVLDGRYALYPDQRLQSGSHEHYAVIDAARASGMGITLHTAPHTYTDEMSKRTKLFQLGLCEAETHTDWFFILDGDEVLVECPPKQQVVDALDAYREDGVGVVSATLWEKADPHQSELRTETNMKLATDWRYECSTPRFWLSHANMRVVGYHYNYVGEDELGTTVELWGHDSACVNRAKWASECGSVIIENRNRLRGIQRDKDRQQYYADRDACEMETVKPLEEYDA